MSGRASNKLGQTAAAAAVEELVSILMMIMIMMMIMKEGWIVWVPTIFDGSKSMTVQNIILIACTGD